MAVALAMSLAGAASAQSTQPKSEGVKATSPRTQANTPAAKDSAEVRLIGCLELEKDYRARVSAGKGGVLGSGVGVGNEYVLTNAMPAPENLSAARPKGTAGTGGTDYMLTGKEEPTMRREVGRQVHVLGTVTKSGSDSKELQRVTVSAWHPMTDYCPGK
jgi:hypothetical protein